MTRFFPFHPLRIRITFLACALLCAAITAWALYNAMHSEERLAEARGGLSAGLMFAFLYAFWSLRPKEGWGVEVEPLRIIIARPFRGAPTRLLWAEIEQIHLGGKKRDKLLLFLEGGGRVMVPGHLFAHDDDFRALCDLARQKVSPTKFDA